MPMGLTAMRKCTSGHSMAASTARCLPHRPLKARRVHHCQVLAMSKSPQPPNKKQQKQQGNAKAQQNSSIDVFIRSNPITRRFLDGTLILGDVVMIMATEASSDRVPWEQMPMFGLIMSTSWVLCGAVVGDYTMELFNDVDDLMIAAGWPTFLAILNASVTWGLSTFLCLGAYSWLVSHWIVEPSMVLELKAQSGLPAQLEINVALLVIMTSWRGIATKLRM